MSDDEIKRLRKHLEPLEGRVHHMYLDTRGNVTTAIGHLIASADDAVALPFVPHEPVREDWRRVKEAHAGFVADWYAPLTTARLTDEAINDLFARTAKRFLGELAQLFPEYDSWPWPARLATFDMIYSMGSKRLHKYVHMIAALRGRDFRLAAEHCYRHGWGDSPEHPNARNRYTRDLYLQAAAESGHDVIPT